MVELEDNAGEPIDGGDPFHELHSNRVWTVHASDGVVYSASLDDTVTAVDAADGSELWTHDLHSDRVYGVHASDGVVYSASWDDTVRAVHAGVILPPELIPVINTLVDRQAITDVTVDTTISHDDGDPAENEPVDLLADDTVVSTEEVTLGEGEDTEVTFTAPETELEYGDVTLTVQHEDESDSGNTTVVLPAPTNVSGESQ